jgi:glucosamine kinase
MAVTLIADSGATKCEWRIIHNGKSKAISTMGISPYFLSGAQITALITKEILPKIKKLAVTHIYFYGTGLSNSDNVTIVKKVFKTLFPKAKTEVQTDLLGAARALCGKSKGVACILGTGANSCYYDGKKIVKNSPGLGYIRRTENTFRQKVPDKLPGDPRPCLQTTAGQQVPGILCYFPGGEPRSLYDREYH